MIAGSVLGGVLARPATQFPSLFSESGLFGIYPYLLPCLVSAVLNFVGLVLGYLFLKETVLSYNPTSKDDNNAFVRVPSSEKREVDMAELEMVELDPAPVEQEKESSIEVDVRSMSFGKGLIYTGKQFMAALRTRAVLVTILLYSVHAAVWLCFDEVFAVWALQTVSAGGLAFQEKSIGLAHAISGVGMLFLQLFAYPALDKAVGSRRAFQITIGILAPACALMPFTNALASGSFIFLWVCVGTLMAIKSAMGTGGMAAINLMINNASDPKSVGAINGLSASIAAASRLVAPTLGGSTYAWSLNNGLPFPLDFHFVFLVLGLICIGMVVATQVWLDKAIDIRRKAR
jgi:Na+/melibiose symporter-like transporter